MSDPYIWSSLISLVNSYSYSSDDDTFIKGWYDHISKESERWFYNDWTRHNSIRDLRVVAKTFPRVQYEHINDK